MNELAKLLELVHGAQRRYRTLTAAVAHWGPNGREVGRLWVETPSRRRWEIGRREGAPRVWIVDGERGWYTDPYGHWSPIETQSVAAPAWESLAEPWPLVWPLDLEIGDRVRCAGRTALQVRATTPAQLISLGSSAATRCELAVDLERGILLRLEGWDWRSGDSEGWEMGGPSFDEPLPAGLFAPPAQSDRQPPGRIAEVTLPDAARLVAFAILVPQRLPEGARARVFHIPARGRPSPHEERIAISYRLAGASHFVHLIEAGEEITTPDLEEWGTVAREDVHEVAGRQFAVWHLHSDGEPSPCRALRFEHVGTHVQLTSDLSLETLLGIAVSLEPFRPDG